MYNAAWQAPDTQCKHLLVRSVPGTDDAAWMTKELPITSAFTVKPWRASPDTYVRKGPTHVAYPLQSTA